MMLFDLWIEYTGASFSYRFSVIWINDNPFLLKLILFGSVFCLHNHKHIHMKVCIL